MLKLILHFYNITYLKKFKAGDRSKQLQSPAFYGYSGVFMRTSITEPEAVPLPVEQ